MPYEETNELKYTIALIVEFADKFGIGKKQAYNYLSRVKEVAHLFSFSDMIHILSFENAIDIMVQVCHQYGGRLR